MNKNPQEKPLEMITDPKKEEWPTKGEVMVFIVKEV